jgi:hypothetical protein
MANYIGGSAFAMANQIADGYLLLNLHHLKKLTLGDINTLKAELEKIMKDARAEQPPLDQTELLQKRNRKISRINTAFMMLNAEMEKKRKASRI